MARVTQRRYTGRKRIFPIHVVIASGREKRRTEVADSANWWSHAWLATLQQHGSHCGAQVAREIPHPHACPIALDVVYGLAAGPLIEQIREVDTGPHGNFDRGREPRIDLHQVGTSRGVATELDFRVA